MKKLYLLLIPFLLCACNKEKLFDGPNSYSDGFEDYKNIEALIDGNDQLWSYFQNTEEGNSISLDSTIVHSGKYSIRSTASVPNDLNSASKASFAKQKMAFWEGEVVLMEAWYYIKGEASAEWLFLFDLEEQVSIGAGPGIRLALVNDRLLIEHKYPNPNIQQTEQNAINFPRNQWVKVNIETKLSRKKKGYIKVWQDDQLVLDQENWKTLPSDALYYQQGTKGMYSSIQFGITANTVDNDMTIFVDDIDVRQKK